MHKNGIAIFYAEPNKHFKFQFNKLCITILTCFIIFKSVFTYLDIEQFGYIFSLLFLFINLVLLDFKLPIRSCRAMPFIFVGILSLTVLILTGSMLIGGVGFVGTYFYMIFWFVSISLMAPSKRESFFVYFVNLNIILAAITAGFAIYQYFVDPTLFGVKPHPLYSNIEMLGDLSLTTSSGITRRATSFIGSPQNLGIYLGIMCGCLFLSKHKKISKLFLFCLFFVGGILSGSGVFIVFMLIFFFAYGLRIKAIKGFTNKVVIGILVLFAIWQMQHIKNIENTVLQSFCVIDRLKLGLVAEYSLDKFLGHENFYQYLFGKGIGISDRLVEVVTNNDPPANWISGSESYLLKIYLELGIAGILTFTALYWQSIYYSYKDESDQGMILFGILSGLVCNLLGTPSFTGLTMSFIIWPFILYPLLSYKQARSVRV